jgi:hypothetical protein
MSDIITFKPAAEQNEPDPVETAASIAHNFLSAWADLQELPVEDLARVGFNVERHGFSLGTKSLACFLREMETQMHALRRKLQSQLLNRKD